ncbi:Serine threonine-kinase SNT7 [Micractinium conductrix]|uniref:Serine threonine-kinase SNT7 n=1 Tax=Micractinium conductrix TaxID=554055 RepID=A0A2P6V2D3_9CHLO|nr:Serine threonine-kinase SNT7 [Micractinium conductrix]|eukprot:PSC68256.1 Serine threonine-kinase SNT7 [Micractinium conductrix]
MLLGSAWRVGAAPLRAPRALGSSASTRRGRQDVVRVHAGSGKYGKYGLGQELQPEWLSPGRSLGSGSFGECYKGTLRTDDGEEMAVVLKRVRARVAGAEEMHEAEHSINVLATKAAGDAVAPFLGYTLVESPVGRLTKGLWLVWEYEGDKTLAYYLKRRDLEKALAADLGVEEEEAVPMAMKQIFECLQALHSAGIVHRDIKPANIVFDERARRFRLIDLGAAACLKTGTNYKPGETILDPCYCPPEEYVLPTEAPNLADQGTRLRTVLTPLLWTQHSPDCFDTYSAGIVLMQLGLPFLRTTSSLRTFNGALARCNHDLEEWRARSGLPSRQTALLDANDGAGWDLAANLLRPRQIVNDDRGSVIFLNTGRAPRLTATGALKHPFLRAALRAAPAAAAPPSPGNRGGSGSSGSAGRSRGGSRGEAAAPVLATRASGGGRGGGGALKSVWGALKGKLFDLEARVMQEATATEVQTNKVTQLRSDVAAGRASASDLRKEESVLVGMQRGLTSSVKEMNSVYGAARGFFSAVLGSSGGSAKSGKGGSGKGGGGGRSAAAAGDEQQQQQPGKRMPKWAAKEVPLEQVPGAVVPSRRRQEAEPAAAAAYQAEEEQEEDSVAAAEAAGAAAGVAVSQAATGFLSFAGRAASGLSSFAASIREQAKKGAAEAAAEAAVQKRAAAAYLEALQAVQPALTPMSSFGQASFKVPESAAYSVLSERRREQIFTAYVTALDRAERAARSKAQAAYQDLLVTCVLDEGLAYSEFEASHGSDARFQGLGEAERAAAFEAFTSRMRAAREATERREAEKAEAAARAAARSAARAAEQQAREVRAARRAAEVAAAVAAPDAAAEVAFRQLMAEHKDMIAAGAGYAQLKLKMWADPRFDAVPEQRRSQLYGEYSALLQEAGLLVGGASAPAPAPAGGEGATQDEAELDWLRQEQARLKEEYAKMEAKLRTMEQRLQLDGSAVAVGAADMVAQALEALPPGTAAAAVVEEGDSTTFRFKEGMPSAADYSKTVETINGTHAAK